jgi:hypothetical protein
VGYLVRRLQQICVATWAARKQISSLIGIKQGTLIICLEDQKGTLFGRNATGGVTNFQSRRPSEQVALDANIGFRSFRTVDGSRDCEPKGTRL